MELNIVTGMGGKIMKATRHRSPKNVEYTYINNNSQNICIMLSGGSYTYEKPLLYYATMLTIENQFDIVHVNYSYGPEYFENTPDQIQSIITEDVSDVLQEVFAKKSYDDIIFIGKSLGTIPMAFNFILNESYSDAKFIFLTPLLKLNGFIENLRESNQASLIVIGTNDHYYLQEPLSKLNTNISLLEIPNADHSLELVPTNASDSIKVMDLVISTMNTFIKEN